MTYQLSFLNDDGSLHSSHGCNEFLVILEAHRDWCRNPHTSHCRFICIDDYGQVHIIACSQIAARASKRNPKIKFEMAY